MLLRPCSRRRCLSTEVIFEAVTGAHVLRLPVPCAALRRRHELGLCGIKDLWIGLCAFQEFLTAVLRSLNPAPLAIPGFTGLDQPGVGRASQAHPLPMLSDFTGLGIQTAVLNNPAIGRTSVHDRSEALDRQSFDHCRKALILSPWELVRTFCMLCFRCKVPIDKRTPSSSPSIESPSGGVQRRGSRTRSRYAAFLSSGVRSWKSPQCRSPTRLFSRHFPLRPSARPMMAAVS